jgi:predicted ArsR family transcriptional regulator
MEKFLTEETKKLLRYQHRQEKDGRTRDRIKAILLADQGWTYRQIAQALLLTKKRSAST